MRAPDRPSDRRIFEMRSAGKIDISLKLRRGFWAAGDARVMRTNDSDNSPEKNLKLLGNSLVATRSTSHKHKGGPS